MTKKFTLSDVKEITDACYITGVEQVWCRILFNGCVNPHEFLATPISADELSRELYEKFKAGQLGKLNHGTAAFKTQPAEQPEVEARVIAKRNQLLLESDFADLPTTQARLNSEQKAAWANYRQALRDLTDQVQFPWDPVWPTKP